MIRTLQSLASFNSENELATAVTLYMANRYQTQEQLDNLRTKFMLIDKNGTGFISYTEIKEAMREIKGEDYTEEQCEAICKACDLSHDGEISLEEFITSAYARNKLLSNENLRKAFMAFDQDNDGEITIRDLENVFLNADKAHIKKIFED